MKKLQPLSRLRLRWNLNWLVLIYGMFSCVWSCAIFFSAYYLLRMRRGMSVDHTKQ